MRSEIPSIFAGKLTVLRKLGPACLALEVIYNQGSSPVVYSGTDDWTIVTRDGSVSGLFEHTLLSPPKALKLLRLKPLR